MVKFEYWDSTNFTIEYDGIFFQNMENSSIDDVKKMIINMFRQYGFTKANVTDSTTGVFILTAEEA